MLFSKLKINLISLNFKKVRPIKPLCVEWRANHQDLIISVRKLNVTKLYYFQIYRDNQLIYESVQHKEFFMSFKDAVAYINKFITKPKILKKLGITYPA